MERQQQKQQQQEEELQKELNDWNLNDRWRTR
jgi:hypothetical protein